MTGIDVPHFLLPLLNGETIVEGLWGFVSSPGGGFSGNCETGTCLTCTRFIKYIGKNSKHFTF